jgi:prevent-host-death family protein
VTYRSKGQEFWCFGRLALGNVLRSGTQKHEKRQRDRHQNTGSFNSHIIQAIVAIMKKASITEAKNNLSALIDGLKGGSPVLIVDRGRPVARLEPVSTGPRAEDDGRLGRLVREGIVRPARAPVPKAVFASKPPRPAPGASGVRALLEDRRAGR